MPLQTSLHNIVFLISAGAVIFSSIARTPPLAAVSQGPDSSGGFYQSSSNGSDYDQFVWDDFTVPATTTIARIDWFGVFDPAKFGSGGPVTDFHIALYASIPAGTQPDIVNAPLADYRTGGNAGETAVGQFKGTTGYKYSYVLPTLFMADSGKKYWLQIEAMQSGIPDWSIAAGLGGNGSHFRRISNAGDMFYQTVAGDAAFMLFSQATATAVPKRGMTKSFGPAPSFRFTGAGDWLELVFPRESLGEHFRLQDVRGRTIFAGAVAATEMKIKRAAKGHGVAAVLTCDNKHCLVPMNH